MVSREHSLIVAFCRRSGTFASFQAIFAYSIFDWNLAASDALPMQKSIHSPDYQHFLAELRALRERLGISQEQLAEALGEHQTLISKVERGVRRLDVIELRNWLAAMNVKLADFVTTLESRLTRHSLPAARQKRAR